MKFFSQNQSAVKLTVTGTVQGVGYRPFVRREALRRSIDGAVQNSGGGVCIYACGEREALDSFVRCLRLSPPVGTVYTSFECEWVDADRQSASGFIIEESGSASLLPIVLPDLAPCSACERELFDRTDRRYRHAFISCALCGPRFSLQSALPYDRTRTSMDSFALCKDCAVEYNSIEDRRSYAQTLSCPNCGPRLTYRLRTAQEKGQKALDACIAHLKSGGIDAVKNVGGFHLVCRADDEVAVESLRVIKGREEKPFALLFADLDQLRLFAEVSEGEAELLTSSARPIVLLRRKTKNARERIAHSVCCNSLYIGAMLPSSPLQHLLVRETGVLVMTSANRSGDALCCESAQLEWLPDSVGVLDNDRPIIAEQDDSVCFVLHGEDQERALLIRRARGYAPLPIKLPKAVSSPTLAAGGDLKAVFGLARGQYVYLSPAIGDLEYISEQARWSEMLDHMAGLFAIAPTRAVCDLHPRYYSAKMAEHAVQSSKNELILPSKHLPVQHHHAHIASVMAEHSLERVLGFAFDGTGYGSDGTVWGGELLLCEGAKFERLTHLKTLPLLGGDSAATQCDRTASTFLLASGCAPWDEDSRILSAVLKAGVGTILTSSMGRLFDAAASILELCHCNRYEGQAATMLEACAIAQLEAGGDAALLELPEDEGVWRSDLLLLELRAQKARGVQTGELALGFHCAIADAVIRAAGYYSEVYRCKEIALSGGCFANRLLLTLCIGRLTAIGLRVFINEQLPAGDGNIALGQAYIAALSDESS